MSRLLMHKRRSRALLESTFLRSLAQDTSGNVLPLTAAALVVLMGLVGGAVDMSGAYKVERRLQAACDAGVLAGRRAVTTNGFDTTAQTQANLYFNNNFDAATQQATPPVFTPTSTDNGNTIKATATTSSKAIIMKVFGYQTMNMTVNCSASMGVGNSDVTMVLDTTGSMADNVDGGNPTSSKPSKISSLRASMKSFYTTVKTATGSSNARVRYAFVPYSSAVNVGRVLNDTNPAYLANSVAIQSYQYVNWSAVVKTWTGSGTTDPEYSNWNYVNTNQNYSNLNNCNNAKPADSAWANSGGTYNSTSVSIDPDNGQQVTAVGTQQDQTQRSYQCYYYSGNNRYYVIYRDATRTQSSYNYSAKNQIPVTTNNAAYADLVYQQRTFDTSAYKTFQSVTLPMANVSANSMPTNSNANKFTGSGTTKNQTFTWPGCVEERQTVAADAFAFDSLSTGITPSAAYDLDIDMAPTSDDATKWKPMWPEMPYYRASFDIKYSKSGTDTGPACPTAAKLLNEISQSDFNSYADSLNPSGGTYHDIGLIWGARFSSTTGIFASNVNSKPSNGGSVSRHLIFMTDGQLDPDPSTYSSYGIERQDRRVTPNGTDPEQVARHRSRFLAVCEAIKARGIRLWVIAFGTSLGSDLSTCASTNSAFEADDADELDEQFQEIAKQVGELRITQ